MPTKVWIPGEEVLAADWNTYVQEQVVATFANAAARAAAIAAPKVGMVTYRDDAKVQEWWDGAAWRPTLPHTAGVRRVMGADNALSNPTSYTILPNAADRAALTMSFTKYSPSTVLVLSIAGTFAIDSGVGGQRFYLGLRVNSTDYDVSQLGFYAGWTLTAPWRVAAFPGHQVVSGLAAGVHTIQPVVKLSSAAAVNFHITDDWISYTVTETF